MPRVNTEWLQKQYDAKGEDAPDEYVLEILKRGEMLLDLIDTMAPDFPLDANALMHQVAKGSGITGNMAGYIALIATKCSDRGEEFRKSWNMAQGKPESTGVVNPAIITIGDKAGNVGAPVPNAAV